MEDDEDAERDEADQDARDHIHGPVPSELHAAEHGAEYDDGVGSEDGPTPAASGGSPCGEREEAVERRRPLDVPAGETLEATAAFHAEDGRGSMCIDEQLGRDHHV